LINAKKKSRSWSANEHYNITQKELVQSYGDWVIDHLNFPHQEDPLTHLLRKMKACPNGTMEQVRQWAKEYVDLEWEAFFMTFMFRHIPGSDQEKIRQTHKNLARFYGKLASWVVRDPKSPKYAHLLPRAVFLTCLAISGKSRPYVT
jgi:hypothetical protein